MDFYIYTWTRPDTGNVFYVGKGRGRRDTVPKSNNSIFVRIIEKLKRAGVAPTVVRIHTGLSETEAFDLERQEIKRHGRINNGTGTLSNLTDGGEGSSGWIPSDETRSRISATKTGKKIAPMSAAGRRNLSNSLLGKPKSPEHRAKMREANLGKKLSEETRSKISKAAMGRTPSEETRVKLSAAQRGKMFTPETRAKISAAHMGKSHSEEARAKMSRSGRGKPHSAEHVANVTMALRMNPGTSTSKSGLKGVSPRGSKWQARITRNGKRTLLGSFSTMEEAGLAYDSAAIELFGHGNCYLNFPEKGAASC